jgi:ABC-type glutathione transport system ATPase component
LGMKNLTPKESKITDPIDIKITTEKFLGIQKRYLELKITQKSIEKQYQDLADKRKQKEKRIEDAQRALAIIQEVAQRTQEKLEFHISSLVTTALESIDPNWPEFVVKISIRRNRTECDLLFREHGVDQRPEDSSGGGVKDVVSFALRIAYWSLKKNRATFILDEPFRNVSPDLQEKVSEMLKMLSDRLGLQIIMVSHAEDINIAANKTFYNTKKGKHSEVKEI